MSLGLNDLKKRTAPRKTTSPSLKEEPAAAVSEKWARGNRTARPWTSSGLSKGSKARRSRAEESDAYMSEEWSTDHTSTLQAFDMEVQSALAQLRDLKLSLKEQAVEIERKIKRAAKSPFEIAKSVLRLVRE